jgi:hypothetical protein
MSPFCGGRRKIGGPPVPPVARHKPNFSPVRADGASVLPRGGERWTRPVLPRGRNFGRKIQKGPCVGPGKYLGPNFLQIYQKRAEKGPNFSVVWFCTKTVIFSVAIVNPFDKLYFSLPFCFVNL